MNPTIFQEIKLHKSNEKFNNCSMELSIREKKVIYGSASTIMIKHLSSDKYEEYP